MNYSLLNYLNVPASDNSNISQQFNFPFHPSERNVNATWGARKQKQFDVVCNLRGLCWLEIWGFPLSDPRNVLVAKVLMHSTQQNENFPPSGTFTSVRIRETSRDEAFYVERVCRAGFVSVTDRNEVITQAKALPFAFTKLWLVK